MCVYIYIYIYNACTHIYIYIYIWVCTLRYLSPPNASVQWQPDGLTFHTEKWFPGAGFLGAPPISLVLASKLRGSVKSALSEAFRLRRWLEHVQKLRHATTYVSAARSICIYIYIYIYTHTYRHIIIRRRIIIITIIIDEGVRSAHPRYTGVKVRRR